VKRFWLLVGSVVVFAGVPSAAWALGDDGRPAPPRFTHGVASGDVTPWRAILWTRVDRAATLKVEVWNSGASGGKKVFHDVVRAKAQNDFTVKIDAKGLRPGTAYRYRFRSACDQDDGGGELEHAAYRQGDDDDDMGRCHGSAASPVGKFETAPHPNVAVDARFAYTADSDGTRAARPPTFKAFEVLDRIREEMPDFWSYLGDTIYSDSRLRASPATTLDEYRDAYKENRSYPALSNLLKATSTYAQWDDHEVYDDFDGQTVDAARYAAGREAFLEYMPIREANLLEDPSCAGPPLYREFRWGREIQLIIPDERSCRSASVESACPTPAGHPLGPTDPAPRAPQPVRSAFFLPPPPQACLDALADPHRTMLGAVQKEALKDALLNSTAKFKLVLNEVPIQQFWAVPYDRWEGYEAERREIIDFIRDRNIPGVLFLTTDFHATLVNQVFIDRNDDPQAVFDEAVTGPIATDTRQQQILMRFGAPGLSGFNTLMNLAGMDCRQLDQFSYGSVNAALAQPTPTIAFRDDSGAPIQNQGPTGGPACVYPPTPPVP
jgi:alkaline phosphatase D